MEQPDWTAQIDQMAAGARDLAKGAAAYFASLLDEGLSADVAVALTNGWVGALVVASLGGSEGE